MSGTFPWCWHLKWKHRNEDAPEGQCCLSVSIRCLTGLSSISRWSWRLKGLSSISKWSWTQIPETWISKKAVVCLHLCMGSVLHRVQCFGNQRLQAEVTQNMCGFPYKGWCDSCYASALALTKDGDVAECCIWDGTGLFVCTALWFCWYSEELWDMWDTHYTQHSKGNLKKSHTASWKAWPTTAINWIHGNKMG